MILDATGFPIESRTLSSPRGSAGGLNWAFEQARKGGFRGWWYFPTLDPSEMAQRQTREDAAMKAWWLYDNVDIVGTIIDGLATEEVDTGIYPKATTSNAFFNRAVNEAFERECNRAESCDAAEEETFYSAQVLIRRHVRLVGEHFAQLLEPMPEAGAPLPSFHFINAWQCGNVKTTLDQSRWDDGIYRNRLKRALQFRFATNKERTSWVDVSRENVLHFHDQFWTGQGRGMSALAPVTRKLFRYDEVERAEASGMLLRTRLAYAITKKNADGGGPTLLPGGKAEILEQPDGTKLMVQRIVSGDTEVDVADLPPDFDLKVVESNRAQMTPEWLKWMLFGIGSCFRGYPPDYVFSLGGISNGTMVRSVQKRVQRVKNSVRNFQLVKQFVPYWYEFWLWQRIKQGLFDKVQGGIPEDFLRHKIIMPADDTVDVGREGRLYDDRFATGKMSPEQYFGMQGEDAEDVEDEIIERAVRIKRKIAAKNKELAGEGIQIEEGQVFRAPNGAAPSAPAKPDDEEDPEENADDDEDDDEEDEEKKPQRRR